MSPRVAIHLLVSGIVQGVGYRAWTERTAHSLGLGGWVRNLHDGRVEIWAEGIPAALDELEARCRIGPRSAQVTSIERRDEAATGLGHFEARPTAESPSSRDR